MSYKLLMDKHLHIRFSEIDEERLKELEEHFKCKKSIMVRKLINDAYEKEILNKGEDING